MRSACAAAAIASSHSRSIDQPGRPSSRTMPRAREITCKRLPSPRRVSTDCTGALGSAIPPARASSLVQRSRLSSSASGPVTTSAMRGGGPCQPANGI